MIRTHRRFILGLCAGIVVGVFVAGIGFFALESFWPAYAMAKITASYDLTMYCARLCLGVCGVTSSGYIATLVANDRGQGLIPLDPDPQDVVERNENNRLARSQSV